MKRKTEDCSFRTSIGGQALIEGILMRGPKKQAVVCRTKDGLVEKVEELELIRDKHPMLGLPFIRGVVTLFDSLFKSRASPTSSINGSRPISRAKRPRSSSSARPWCWAWRSLCFYSFSCPPFSSG